MKLISKHTAKYYKFSISFFIATLVLCSCHKGPDIEEPEDLYVGLISNYGSESQDYYYTHSNIEINGNETFVFGEDFCFRFYFLIGNLKYQIQYPQGTPEWLHLKRDDSNLDVQICDYAMDKDFTATIQFYNNSRKINIILKQPRIKDTTLVNDYLNMRIIDNLRSEGLPEIITFADLKDVKSIRNNYDIEFIETLKLFPNLERIEYWRTHNPVIDFALLPNLKYLYCENMALDIRNAKDASSLVEMHLFDSSFSSSELIKFPKLEYFDISTDENIDYLNISSNTIKELRISEYYNHDAKLQNIALNVPNLEEIWITNADEIKEINIINQQLLKKIDLYDLPKLSYLNISEVPQLNYLQINSCALSSIDVSKCGLAKGTNNSSIDQLVVHDMPGNVSTNTFDIYCTQEQYNYFEPHPWALYSRTWEYEGRTVSTNLIIK